MDVGATFSAITLLIVPSLGQMALSPTRFTEPAPILSSVSSDSHPYFWADAISIEVEDENEPEATAARSSIQAWNDQLGGRAFFETSESPSIKVVFLPNLQENGCAIAGYTTWSRDEFGNLHAVIELRTTTPNGRPMPPAALRHAALHELGHALGLEDSRHGVMSALNLRHPVQSPSLAEVIAVRQLREASALECLAARLSF